MKIKLVLGLDGIKPKRIQSTMGEKEVGLVGFLSILETQCGIAPLGESSTIRIIEYLSCLKDCDNPKRFYHLSFEVDQFNVAKTLLLWRDSLYEAGWCGFFSDSVSSRLQDIADVEQLALKKVSHGFGQRQQAVLASLKTQTTQIEQVILLDSLAGFSPLWQQILQSFDITEQPALLPPTKPTTDLGRLQKTLMQLASENISKDDSGSIKKITLKGDFSFVVVRARSKDISARLISQWLAEQSSQNQQKTVAVLSGSDGVKFDDALAAVDLPRLGFEKQSPWRPVLQVLPISLEFLWEPLNPQILLQMLMQPIGILPCRICFPLAPVVARTPGIGGEKWQKALANILENEKNRDGYNEKSHQKLLSNCKYWFASERYLPNDGLPIEVAQKRISKVAHWLTHFQLFSKDKPMCVLFDAACSQANELSIVLNNLLIDGTTHIKPEQLRYLLGQLSGSGTRIADQFAECIPNQSQWLVGANQPDSFNQAVNTVIWWDLQPTDLQTNYPWSKQELKQLDGQGVLLPNLDQQLQRQALSWLKPINAAQDRLIIVLHDSEESHHPLWDQISSAMKNWHEIRAEDSILEGNPISALNNLQSVHVDYSPLSSLSRRWKLESGETLGNRKKESYSSMEQFFYSPYQWVLRHKARLTTGSLQLLSDGNVLKGNLVHHLYERFFNENITVLNTNPYDDVAVNHWLDHGISTLLREEGAVLLQPGRLIEKEQFIATTRKSLHELIRHLKTAKVVHIEMELMQEAEFFGGNLGGYMDMKVLNATGEEAVVDIKWGGAKYHKADLKGNRHLQLVTYSYMRHKKSDTKQWSAVAYFIIKDGGAMLAQNTHYFPNAIQINAVQDENHAVIWQKMKNTWDWRRKQLDDGLIEITVGGTNADADSMPGEDALSIPETNDRFNDYRVLTGWKE